MTSPAPFDPAPRLTAANERLIAAQVNIMLGGLLGGLTASAGADAPQPDWQRVNAELEAAREEYNRALRQLLPPAAPDGDTPAAANEPTRPSSRADNLRLRLEALIEKWEQDAQESLKVVESNLEQRDFSLAAINKTDAEATRLRAAELRTFLDECAPLERMTHVSNGRDYEVLSHEVLTRTAGEEWVDGVLYRSLDTGKLYVRPSDNFLLAFKRASHND